MIFCTSSTALETRICRRSTCQFQERHFMLQERAVFVSSRKENQFKALWNICACAAPGIKLIVHCVWQTVYHATELVNTEEPILKTDEINWYFHADTIGWKGEFITCINLLSTSYRLILYPFGAEHPIIPLHIVAILSQFMFYSKSWQDFKDYR